jgi:hypothetical protein
MKSSASKLTKVLKATVITCTHNPRPDYLVAAVEALAHQTLPTNQWEYLVIDNASSPGKGPTVDLSWHPHGKMIREETLGLTAARLRGIREAQGETLVFVDDDNVLEANYLEQVIKTGEDKPFLGSWSGQCLPSFDEPPPEWTRQYWGNLAIRKFDRDVWSNLPRLADTMPCGAGLCVRREVAQHYARSQEARREGTQLDRKGDSLLSGGDNELAGCACDLGLGVGLIASLKLTHLIPAQRLTVDYLARLAEGIQFSSLLLDADRNIDVPERNVLGKVVDQLRLLRLRTPHREISKAVYRGRANARLELGRRLAREDSRGR